MGAERTLAADAGGAPALAAATPGGQPPHPRVQAPGPPGSCPELEQPTTHRGAYGFREPRGNIPGNRAWSLFTLNIVGSKWESGFGCTAEVGSRIR